MARQIPPGLPLHCTSVLRLIFDSRSSLQFSGVEMSGSITASPMRNRGDARGTRSLLKRGLRGLIPCLLDYDCIRAERRCPILLQVRATRSTRVLSIPPSPNVETRRHILFAMSYEFIAGFPQTGGMWHNTCLEAVAHRRDAFWLSFDLKANGIAINLKDWRLPCVRCWCSWL